MSTRQSLPNHNFLTPSTISTKVTLLPTWMPTRSMHLGTWLNTHLPRVASIINMTKARATVATLQPIPAWLRASALWGVRIEVFRLEYCDDLIRVIGATKRKAVSYQALATFFTSLRLCVIGAVVERLCSKIVDDVLPHAWLFVL